MYRVVFHPRAQKELASLPRIKLKKVSESIKKLQENPFYGKKLEGDHLGLWVIRVWPYRVVYSINKKIVTVTIVEIGHRQGIYN